MNAIKHWLFGYQACFEPDDDPENVYVFDVMPGWKMLWWRMRAWKR